MRIGICWVALLLLASVTARGATVDPPQRIKVTRIDKTELSGLVTAYDENGIDVMDAQKQISRVPWDTLPADVVINWNERLVRKGTADDWLKLGKKLLAMPGGRGPAERAFRKALALDPSFKELIATARKEAAASLPAKILPPTAPPTARQVEETAATQRSAFDPRDPNKKVVGPQQVGKNDPAAWEKQSAEQQIENVKALKAFAEQAREVTPALRPYETAYFLFYSDLDQREAQNWVLVLDRMYAKMAQVFGMPPGENLWHGKALVFVFSREEDYLKFEVKLHGSVAAGTAGMCHTFGTGEVHIAFYRQPNDIDFAQLLVHESSHAFLHRYRAPGVVPSWANEGLAETIATDMVPNMGKAQSSLADARADLQTRKSLEKFFDADHIVAWQYPVARTLTEFMIKQNKQGYVEFINAIKDGTPWDEALRTKYGATSEQLAAAYGQSIGVAGLTP